MIQIQKIRSKKNENIITNTTEVLMIIKGYFKTLYTNKLENLLEVYIFKGTCFLPKLKKEDIRSLNKSVTSNVD